MNVPRRASPGQGAVEYLGIVLVVAAMLGFAALGIARLRAGDRLPAAAARDIAVPIDTWSLADRDSGGGVVGRVWRGFNRAGGLLFEGVFAFNAGLRDGVRADIAEFVDDPIGMLVGTGRGLGALLRDPVGMTRAEVAEALNYARMLRRMPPDAAYRRVMYDLGELTEDIAVSRGRRAIRRRLLRELRTRLERRAGDRPAGPEAGDGD